MTIDEECSPSAWWNIRALPPFAIPVVLIQLSVSCRATVVQQQQENTDAIGT
jgi:hypothetical protein